MSKRKQYFFTCLKCNHRKPVEEEAYNAGHPGECWACYHKQADIDERECPDAGLSETPE